MTIKSIINEWIAASTCFRYTKKYLSFYFHDAILDDPSVGEEIYGTRRYQKDYFEKLFHRLQHKYRDGETRIS